MAHPSRIAKIVALFVAWISFAHAQAPSGSIAGVIRDSAGAAMTAAQVKILSTSIGLARTMATSATGDYSFPFLPPGEYEVSVEASGFQRTIRKASVEAGETTTTDFNLAIGDVKESVNVDGLFEGHNRKITLSLRSSVPSELKSQSTTFLDEADPTKLELSIGQLFCFLAPRLAPEHPHESPAKSEQSVRSELARALSALHIKVPRFNALALSFFGTLKSLESFADVLVKQKLISISCVRGTEYWSLTDYGRQQYDLLTSLHEE